MLVRSWHTAEKRHIVYFTRVTTIDVTFSRRDYRYWCVGTTHLQHGRRQVGRGFQITRPLVGALAALGFLLIGQARRQYFQYRGHSRFDDGCGRAGRRQRLS